MLLRLPFYSLLAGRTILKPIVLILKSSTRSCTVRIRLRNGALPITREKEIERSQLARPVALHIHIFFNGFYRFSPFPCGLCAQMAILVCFFSTKVNHSTPINRPILHLSKNLT